MTTRKKKGKREICYTITLKGLIDNDQVYDSIELYMRRFGFNIMVLHDGIISFEKAIFRRSKP